MTENDALKAYFDMLPHKEHASMMKKITEACMVKPITLRQWKCSNRKIRAIYKKVIVETIGTDIFANCN